VKSKGLDIFGRKGSIGHFLDKKTALCTFFGTKGCILTFLDKIWILFWTKVSAHVGIFGRHPRGNRASGRSSLGQGRTDGGKYRPNRTSCFRRDGTWRGKFWKKLYNCFDKNIVDLGQILDGDKNRSSFGQKVSDVESFWKIIDSFGSFVLNRLFLGKK
jgi:hypothetical protein